MREDDDKHYDDHDIPRRRRTSYCGPERLCGSPCCSACFGKAAAQAYVDGDEVVEEDMDDELLEEDVA